MRTLLLSGMAIVCSQTIFFQEAMLAATIDKTTLQRQIAVTGSAKVVYVRGR
jgi:hypothetical protein